MSRIVTFQGVKMALAGRRIRIGGRAPDFKLVSRDFKDVSFSDFKGKTLVINSFPSLDTPVCDLQVKEFNKRAAGISPDVVVIGVSKDLPFAQARFCALNGVENEVILSDYKSSSFGLNYGLLIREINLLARGSLVIDRNGKIRYMQVAGEVTHPLDFDEVFSALQEVLKNG
ncbi:MAG: thiol peroxidase [Candidatus Omnitrophica bacterium]|nr:thiol peroxidase [Candidatus Omnitrophota bacterium]MDD5042242.1 thiol peroxidase [Candidatus Omnitrophota bacterium]MDD5500097.1 thiol peroxidase [Candidatus Omnitrophota bacterium]